ncbi:5'-nucleotidase [Myxococcaceae bacterium GXIMD 01537]
MLVLDAGNALFKGPMQGMDSSEKARAELLMEQMDAMGTAAMAVGLRDLTLGVDFLKARARRGKMKVLSANLVDARGQRVFPASLVVTEGGVKFGVIGVSPEVPLADAVARPPMPAALAEARRLREQEQVDVVVVLAALPHLEALQLAEQGKGVDLVIPSSDGRGPGMAQRAGFATLLPPGAQGKQLGRLELSVGGPGPFVDLTERSRARENLKVVEANLKTARERLAAAQEPAAKQALEGTVAALEARRSALQKTVAPGATEPGRTHLLSYIQLDGDVPSDEALQKRVERIEPPSKGGH